MSPSDKDRGQGLGTAAASPPRVKVEVVERQDMLDGLAKSFGDLVRRLVSELDGMKGVQTNNETRLQDFHKRLERLEKAVEALSPGRPRAGSTREEKVREPKAVPRAIPSLDDLPSQREETRKITVTPEFLAGVSSRQKSEAQETSASSLPAERGRVAGPSWLKVAQQEETERRERHQQQLQKCQIAIRYWLGLGKLLRIELSGAEKFVHDLLERSAAALDSFTPELEERLQKSHQGLQIVGRMLKRILEQEARWKELSEDSGAPPEFKGVSAARVEDLLKGVSGEEAGKRVILGELQSAAEANQRVVLDANALMEKTRNRLVNFVDRQVLPLLDGVSDGIRNLSVVHGELPKESKASPEWKSFLQCHDLTKKTLDEVLFNIGIQRMEITVGMPIDFKRHEPFEAESAPELEDESVKEVLREGYEYTWENSEKHVLRPARIIAVKNSE